MLFPNLTLASLSTSRKVIPARKTAPRMTMAFVFFEVDHHLTESDVISTQGQSLIYLVPFSVILTPITWAFPELLSAFQYDVS